MVESAVEERVRMVERDFNAHEKVCGERYQAITYRLNALILTFMGLLVAAAMGNPVLIAVGRLVSMFSRGE